MCQVPERRFEHAKLHAMIHAADDMQQTREPATSEENAEDLQESAGSQQAREPETPEKTTQPVMESVDVMRKRRADEFSKDDAEIRAKRKALEANHASDMWALEAEHKEKQQSRQRTFRNQWEKITDGLKHEQTCWSCQSTDDLEGCCTCSKSLCRGCSTKFQKESPKHTKDAYSLWKQRVGKSRLLKLRPAEGKTPLRDEKAKDKWLKLEWDKMQAAEKVPFEEEQNAWAHKRRFVHCGIGEVARVNSFVDRGFQQFVDWEPETIPKSFCGRLICGDCARRVCSNPSCQVTYCLKCATTHLAYGCRKLKCAGRFCHSGCALDHDILSSLRGSQGCSGNLRYNDDGGQLLTP